jgi:hypothetical protein
VFLTTGSGFHSAGRWLQSVASCQSTSPSLSKRCKDYRFVDVDRDGRSDAFMMDPSGGQELWLHRSTLCHKLTFLAHASSATLTVTATMISFTRCQHTLLIPISGFGPPLTALRDFSSIESKMVPAG